MYILLSCPGMAGSATHDGDPRYGERRGGGQALILLGTHTLPHPRRPESPRQHNHTAPSTHALPRPRMGGGAGRHVLDMSSLRMFMLAKLQAVTHGFKPEMVLWESGFGPV